MNELNKGVSLPRGNLLTDALLGYAAAHLERATYSLRVDNRNKFVGAVEIIFKEEQQALRFKYYFGGTIHHKIHELSGSKKPHHYYMWRSSANATLLILEKCLPYIIARKRHAEIMIEYYKTVVLYRGTRKIPQETIDYRLKLVEDLRRERGLLREKTKSAHAKNWVKKALDKRDENIKEDSLLDSLF